MILFFFFICQQITPLSVESNPFPSELLIELHYSPCLDYVAGLMQTRRVWLEAHEQYQKQSYRNRCYVRTANKVDVLTVPVLRGTHHQPIRDCRIDNGQNWQNHHWRCLRGAYGKAPFYEHYAPELQPVYQKKWSFLFDMNYEILTICLKLLTLSVPINLTKCYEKIPVSDTVDARSRINPANNAESYQFYRPVPYPQNFGLDFVPNLSWIDLLFCQGPAARQFLSASFRAVSGLNPALENPQYLT